ncbi:MULTISPECIES: hypothetical protein [unclassified Nostoc]|uniref:hypothetical protein n=1 Tax=unclassified Nostoc TaxID=2593658 RepID=UPI00083CB6C6|nr:MULTISPECIES: hypothetical protein [unclassified Nostoc]ODG97124.1 hypothetical protein A4S05_01705 [Nostoc sp. KVJ20]OYE01933.1 hypothetical protein CDG79_26645 [Nostoc sp. 'Peltigera membranacea cyanobiont' 232]
MTSQIPDTFLYQGEKYELVALDGERLITPQDYGMKPQMLHTACYRGFYSTYEITNDGLFLTEMVIGEVEEGHKSIQGIMPKLPSQNSHGYPTYKGLRLITPFAGRIRLGKDFIQELYVHMGYQKPTAYETLLEFAFEVGKLVSMQDISDENSKNRGAFKKMF